MTHKLNIHDTYGIFWTDEMIARDLVQNFYDSVKSDDFAQKISIEVDRTRHKIVIKGPGLYAIEYLWRIGVGTKAGREDEFAGGFGEGFVVAVLQIMRNTSSSVHVVVGDQRASFRLEAIQVGDKVCRELVCDVTPTSKTDGTELLIEQTSSSLCQAFEDSRIMFRYPENPLFGEIIGKDESRGIYVYKSTRKSGAIFYRYQKRAPYELPYIFCHDREIKTIKTGRDRLDLNNKEVRDVIKNTASVIPHEKIKDMVHNDLKVHWVKGHHLLSTIADIWPSKTKSKIDFPEDFIAKWNWNYDKTAERIGKTLCVESMHKFGMMSSYDLDKKLSDSQMREPEGIEKTRFKILSDAFSAVIGTPMPNYNLQVFIPNDVKSSLEGRYCANGKKIFLNQRILLNPSFSEAFSVFVHEAFHNYGIDGDPRFSDKLTWAIFQIMESRTMIDNFEKQWLDVEEHSIGNSPLKKGAEASPMSKRLSILEQRVDKLEGLLADKQ